MDTLEYLSDFRDWKLKNENFTILDYLPLKVTVEQVLLISQLFFPEIVSENNCIFIKMSRQYAFLHQYKDHFKDDSSLEKYINCVFLECIFPCDTDAVRRKIKKLAEIIKQSWEMYFSIKYPQFNITIEMYEDEFDGWCVTCYQNDFMRNNENKDNSRVKS